MQKLAILLGLMLVPLQFVEATVRVSGYTRKDGTYVAPHYRSNPDGNFYNNWSTVGNVNPYTGKPGWIKSPPKGSKAAVPGGVLASFGSTATPRNLSLDSDPYRPNPRISPPPARRPIATHPAEPLTAEERAEFKQRAEQQRYAAQVVREQKEEASAYRDAKWKAETGIGLRWRR